MAVTAERVTVGGTAVALNPAGPGVRLHITNGAAAISLGDAGVTTTTGFDVAIDGELVVEVDPGDQLFAVSAGSSDVQVLRT